MFDMYLSSIQNMNPKYREFAEQVTSYITSSIDRDLDLYATHGFCTDGGVAGSMIRYAIPEAAIVPLDYWMINDPNLSEQLSKLFWHGIVDLKPFNSHPLDWWVDHHVSAMKENPNARKIRFDKDGDSGSYQLLLSNFLPPLPEYIVELAVMTRITDTAGYQTSPPIDEVHDLSELDLKNFDGDKGRVEQEQRIWLLDDAFGSVQTFKQHLDMYTYLAKDGFMGLSKVLPRINKRRAFRRKGYEVANQIDINTDVIIFTFEEETVDKFTILRRLQERGAKVAVSFSKGRDGSTKISLRRNRKLSEVENKKIQLQEIASMMGGGGHEGASGAEVGSVDEGFSIIKSWSENLGLSCELIEL